MRTPRPTAPRPCERPPPPSGGGASPLSCPGQGRRQYDARCSHRRRIARSVRSDFGCRRWRKRSRTRACDRPEPGTRCVTRRAERQPAHGLSHGGGGKTCLDTGIDDLEFGEGFVCFERRALPDLRCTTEDGLHVSTVEVHRHATDSTVRSTCRWASSARRSGASPAGDRGRAWLSRRWRSRPSSTWRRSGAVRDRPRGSTSR